MTEQDLYSMELHSIKVITDGIEVLRVPTGWIYFTQTGGVFVPKG